MKYIKEKEKKIMKEFQGMCCDSNGCHFTPNEEKTPIKIKMFSDYMCAWCYLADSMLETLKEKYRGY